MPSTELPPPPAPPVLPPPPGSAASGATPATGPSAALVVLSDDETIRKPDDAWLAVPASTPEWLSPCVSIVPGQLLAFHVALARGLNPDEPRSLNKVTLTR